MVGVLSGRWGLQRRRLATAAARDAMGRNGDMRLIATTRCSNATARCARGCDTNKIQCNNQMNKAGATRGKDATQLQDDTRRNDKMCRRHNTRRQDAGGRDKTTQRDVVMRQHDNKPNKRERGEKRGERGKGKGERSGHEAATRGRGAGR